MPHATLLLLLVIRASLILLWPTRSPDLSSLQHILAPDVFEQTYLPFPVFHRFNSPIGTYLANNPTERHLTIVRVSAQPDNIVIRGEPKQYRMFSFALVAVFFG
ncbi:hypothetical protein TNCV_2865291 [Trichonephila clavipes]|nr:hypothetical protein TNCV_2865291 [Trichonephila clavipes]